MILHRIKQGYQKRLWSGGIWLLLAVIILIGSMCFPLNVADYEMELKNLKPSQNYLSYPSYLPFAKIQDIQSGIGFSIALDQDGKVYTWGDLPFSSTTFPNVISQIAVGYHHVLMLDQNQNLHVYKDKNYEVYRLKKPIKKLLADNDYSFILYEDHTISSSNNKPSFYDDLMLYQGEIDNLFLGKNTAAIITTNQELVLFGNESNKLLHIPSMIQENKEKIKDIEISNDFATIHYASNQVAIWEDENTYSIYNHIKEIASSFYAIYFLEETGKIQAFGSNTYNALDIPTGNYDRIFMDKYQMYALNHEECASWGFSGFVLGSDALGRSILLRLLHGGKITLFIGIPAVILEALLALIFGLYAGYFKGKWDFYGMRLCELLASIPYLPILLTVGFYLSDNLNGNVKLFIALMIYIITTFPHLARYIRSAIQQEVEKDYVIATKLLGASHLHILYRTLFPQVKDLILNHMVLAYGDMILIETTISFLGIGIQPPIPTWGNMLEQVKVYDLLENHWWQWAIPLGVLILVLLLVQIFASSFIRKELELNETFRN